MDKKLEARATRLEKFTKNEDTELSRLIEAIHNTVNDLIDRIKNPERQSKLLDMIIHKEDKVINTIIDFIANDYDFSRGYLLSKRSVIASEASEVAGALAIYSDWEDKGYFDGDGDFDESVNVDINMDKKLEQRIVRLEKMLSRKNESAEMSPAEIRAKQAIENAIDALNDAEMACRTIDLDEMWARDDWDKLKRACRIALSYIITVNP